MKCPNCSYDHFAQAKRCECGFDFTKSGVLKPPVAGGGAAGASNRPSLGGYTPPPDARVAPDRTGSAFGLNAQMVVGLLFMAVGIAITVLTYKWAVAEGGGQYVVAYGPIIFGAVTFLRGIGNPGGE